MCAPNNIIEKHLKEKQQQQKQIVVLFFRFIKGNEWENDCKKRMSSHGFLQNVGLQAGPNLLEVKILHVQ